MNLDEAVTIHRDEIGRPPTYAKLEEMGIGREDNVTGAEEPPDVLDSSE